MRQRHRAVTVSEHPIDGSARVFIPDGACYECAMTENDYRLINLRYSCPLLRQEDILAGKVPTAPTISSMIR